MFRRLGNERAVFRLVVAERLQRAMDRRNGQLGPGIKCSCALAGVACPNQIEFTRSHHPIDEPGRFGLDPGLILAVSLPLPLLSDQCRQDDGFPGPRLCCFNGIQIIAWTLNFFGSRFGFNNRLFRGFFLGFLLILAFFL